MSQSRPYQTDAGKALSWCCQWPLSWFRGESCHKFLVQKCGAVYSQGQTFSFPLVKGWKWDMVLWTYFILSVLVSLRFNAFLHLSKALHNFCILFFSAAEYILWHVNISLKIQAQRVMHQLVHELCISFVHAEVIGKLLIYYLLK